MKIWYQSATAYPYDQVYDEYINTLREMTRRAARPDTEIHIEGIKVMAPNIERHMFLEYYQKIQFLNNMIRAEREGYDAFVIGCDLEPGLEEGKSLVNIPVVGISEASYHLAMMMGHLFAIVTSSHAFFQIFLAQVSKYGLASKYLQGPYFYPATEDEIAEGLKKPEALLNKFKKVAGRAVDDGASVIILNPAFIAALAYKTKWNEEKGALILDPVAAVVKTAEMMVDLKKIGIEPARMYGVHKRMGLNERNKILEKYKEIFTISL